MITYDYFIPKNQDEKYILMRFVYDNTDSFIMNTFGYLWETRDWWVNFPVLIAKDGGKIVGLHAYSLNNRYYDTIKTYYIVTHKEYTGRGIAKEMTKIVLEDNLLFSKKFYVNSSADSQGVGFYQRIFKNYSTCNNEFGGSDYEFEDSIENVLRNL